MKKIKSSLVLLFVVGLMSSSWASTNANKLFNNEEVLEILINDNAIKSLATYVISEAENITLENHISEIDKTLIAVLKNNPQLASVDKDLMLQVIADAVSLSIDKQAPTFKDSAFAKSACAAGARCCNYSGSAQYYCCRYYCNSGDCGC